MPKERTLVENTVRSEPHRLPSFQGTRRAFAWSPGNDTLIAILSLIAFTAVYYSNSRWGHAHPWVFFIVFLGIGHLVLNTAIPGWVVFQLRGEGWTGLGITTRRAVGSVILSCLLAAFSVPALLEELRKQPIDIVPHILFNSLVFWEVLFVYGWLQLRLERAFGYLAAIPLTAIAFAGYHIGSMDTAGLTSVFVAGLVFSAVFASTRNLLVLFPLAWAVSSSMGTLMGGFVATWETVLIYVGVFLLQIILLRLLSRHRAAADGAAALN